MRVSDLFSDPASPLFAFGALGAGAKPRDAQVGYAQACADLLASPDRAIGLIQGETGSGKTFGYLIPALLDLAECGGTLVVSTNTLALQKQVFERAIPAALAFVSSYAGVRLKAAKRIGRGNFISVPALEAAIRGLASGGGNPALVAELWRVHADLVADPSRSTRQEVSEVYGLHLSELGLSPYFFENLGIGQHKGDDAEYLAMVSRCAGADVLVVNHALLATNLITFGRVLPKGEEGSRLTLVVDEADSLPGMTQAILSRKLPLREVRSLAGKISLDPASARRVDVAASALEAAFKRIYASKKASRGHSAHASVFLLKDPQSPRDPVLAQLCLELEAHLSAVLGVFCRARDANLASTVHPDDLRVAIGDMEAMCRSMRLMAAGEDPLEKCSLYWSPTRAWPGFHLDGGSPGQVISRLWRLPEMQPDTAVFTSATLTGGEDRASLEGFSIEIGMSRADYARAFRAAFAPVSFGRMDAVVIDQSKAPVVTVADDDEDSEYPTKSNPDIVPWWSGMVSAAASRGGRILVLTPSHRDARLLADALQAAAAKGLLPGRIILHDTRETSASVLRAFEQDEASILVSAVRWVGMDLPGKVRHIVLPRFPLSPPDVVPDSVLEAVLERRGVPRRKIRQMRFPISVSRARRRFLQGIGRGIRVEDDHVTIWVGDSRWPVSIPRSAVMPTVKQKSWVVQMASSIPARFRGAFERADIYDLSSGVRPLVPPRNPPSGKGGFRTPKKGP